MIKSMFLSMVFVLLLLSSVLADGCLFTYDGQWDISPEEEQVAAINYLDGVEHLILSIGTDELKAEKAVWIFPVPSRPEDVAVDIIKAFPALVGEDVIKNARDSIKDDYLAWSLTLLQPVIFMIGGGSFQGHKGMETLAGEFSIYSHLDKAGLTVETITASRKGFQDYLDSRRLEIPKGSADILSNYTGSSTFVVTWIDDVDLYNKVIKSSSDLSDNSRFFDGSRDLIAHSLGVSVTFPTDEVYFPLRPTSVYGDKVIPVNLLIMDHVTPLWPEGLEGFSETTYYRNSFYNIPPELESFFYSEKSFLSGVPYTRIRIDAPSSAYADDLKILNEVPKKVTLAGEIGKNAWLYALILFLITVFVAGSISGLILRKNWLRSCLLGFWNILTIIGLGYASFFSGTKGVTPNNLEDRKQHYKKMFLVFGTIYLLFLMVAFLPKIFYLINFFLMVLVPFIFWLLSFNAVQEYSDKLSKGFYIANRLKFLIMLVLVLGLGLGVMLFFANTGLGYDVEKLIGVEKDFVIFSWVLLSFVLFWLIMWLFDDKLKHWTITLKRYEHRIGYVILFYVSYTVISIMISLLL